MLNTIEDMPEHVYPLWRRLIFPIYTMSQYAVVICLLSIAILVWWFTHYIGMFFVTLAIAYLSLVFSMQVASPSKLKFPANDIQTVIRFLDNSRVFNRLGATLQWSRKLGFRNKPDLTLECDDKMCILIGRYIDLKTVAAYLRSRRPTIIGKTDYGDRLR